MSVLNIRLGRWIPEQHPAFVDLCQQFLIISPTELHLFKSNFENEGLLILIPGLIK